MSERGLANAIQFYFFNLTSPLGATIVVFNPFGLKKTKMTNFHPLEVVGRGSETQL